MQISHIKIKNILGIDALEFSPGAFTEISGKNGQGKTSVLEAIKSAIGGGHDATLLRKGEEQGESVILLDDDTEISRRIKAGASQTDVRREGKKVTRPAELIKALTDSIAVNPVDFLRAPKKDRVRVLLESMPIEADTDYLSEISGIPVDAQEGVHALHVIKSVHEKVYDARTATNAVLKEKRATVNQLRQALPEMPEGLEGQDEEALTKSIADLQITRDTRLEKIRQKLDGLKDATRTSIDDIRTKLQADIDALKTAAQAQVDTINAALEENTKLAAAATAKAQATCTDAVEPIKLTLATIRANRETFAKRTQTIDTINQFSTDIDDLTAKSEGQSQALAEIEKYKSELLETLPIPGLEVIDGEIMRDGIVFDRLNTAQQVDIAVEIAKIRSGDLGIICCDGLELLSTEAFESFKERAIASGLQMFVTRVSDGDLHINTDE